MIHLLEGLYIYDTTSIYSVFQMRRTKQNSKAELNEDGGPIEALGQTGKENPEPCAQNTDQTVLATIVSLQVDLLKAKSDICDKIDEKIVDVSTTQRGEITILKTDTDNAFIAVHAHMNSQNDTLKSLGESTNATSDVVANIEQRSGTFLDGRAIKSKFLKNISVKAI